MRNLFFLLVVVAASCKGNSQQVRTPAKFLNNVRVNADIYSKDSAAILKSLYKKMVDHEDSFTNQEYFDSTILIIDTIMYDSSLNKIAVFVIAQNPTYRNPYSESKLPYYFNAYCYLGKRKEKGTNIFELKCFCRFSQINFEDEEVIRKALREDFFLELATVLDEKQQPIFKYNLDDKRFWDSPTGWKRMFE